MPLRYVAGRGWRGPRAVIVIGDVGQLSARILAEIRREHRKVFRRGRRKRGVRRGSGVPYRHSYFGVSPCAHMRYLSQPSWRPCTWGHMPSHGTQCRCGHCSSHEGHSSETEDVMPKRHFVPHAHAAAEKTRLRCSVWPAWSAVTGFQPHTPPHDPS
jgi:hypothetical protein